MNRKFARHVVDLAQFDFEVQHRAGTENTVADHLSRYPICAVLSCSRENRVLDHQQRDSFCKQIHAIIISDSMSNRAQQLRSLYHLDHGILMHSQPDGSSVVVLPASLHNDVLRLMHNDSGHMDENKTLHRIRSAYWWRHMRRDVRQFVRSCHACQLVNHRTVLPYGLMGHRPLPSTPFEVISADHVVGLPETSIGNKNLIVAIDHATRYVLARAVPTVTADTVIVTLESDIIQRFGVPHTFISDNGPAFVSARVRKFLHRYGVTHHFTPPYTPQANGLVERANGTLVNVLTKALLEHKTDWDQLLPNILLAINTTKQSTTQSSPFFLLHGYTPILPRQLHIGLSIPATDRQTQLELLDHIRAAAVVNTETSHANSKQRYDAVHQDVAFSIGDLVLYDCPATPHRKLQPRFSGPFRIMQSLGATCYIIESIADSKIIKTAHVSCLKKYNPQENMLQDSSSCLTEDVDQVDDNELQDVVRDEQFEVDNCSLADTASAKRLRKVPKHLSDYELF